MLEFDQAYNQADYLGFLVQKFNQFKRFLSPIPIMDNAVIKFERLGFITTADNKTLPVFEIHIKPETQLARNRVQLRNLVVKQIKNDASDGALAVYIDQPNQQWRFSFMTLEPKFDNTGNIIIEQTPSKRYTYLLGKGTQIRTAREQFAKLNKQSTLKHLKDAFAVEPLSKEFYKQLYEWYEKAQPKVIFPNDDKVPNHTHTQTSLIRLITRLLFIWFLKEKHLINPDLFNHHKVQNIIDDNQPSSFYKAILQNLFFATLSVKVNERNFRKPGNFQGKNSHYGNQYRYRYASLVKDKKQWQQSFTQTPFLNGGLFESQDRNPTDEEIKQYQNDKTIRKEKLMVRMEGFSEREDNPLKLPNNLFFNSDEQNLGLIDLFEQYQFTATESTPTDIEIALDPELLGKVFENLLAAYNPETREVARKATGSYYTPREIVQYMVDESLKAHLAEAVPPHDGDNEIYPDRLGDLFSTSDKIDKLPQNNGTTLIYNEEIPQLIAAISQIKILDPAVGSGAFPMGLLQRMTALLAILDPDNELWQKQQLATLPDLTAIEQDLKISAQISDKKAKQKAQGILKDKKQAIINNFKTQDHNYLRKLYLIENCIYGVDIQPIAILIAQLRFFISLTIEQTKDNNKPNYGIKPLPNLDYHLEVGNSLLGLPAKYRPENTPARVQNLLAEIKPLKHRFFIESDHHKKQALRTTITTKIKQCYEAIAPSIGYTADFDFKIDFNEVFTSQDGFNIVLGNPPYIRQESIKQFKPQFKQHYQVFTGTADIYTYFYEKGFNLLNENGHLCYITSNKWMRAKYGEKLRYFFKNTTHLKQIIDFEGEQIFANATVDTNILLTAKGGTNTDFYYQKQLPNKNNPLFTMAISNLSASTYTLQVPKILALKKKIEQAGTPLKDWDVKINYGIKTGYNEAFIIDTAKRNELIATDPKSTEIIKPILRGRDIKRYEAKWAELWIIATFPALKLDIDNYPAVKKYLESFGKRIYQTGEKETRKKTNNKWFETQDQIAYYREFAKEKIIYSEMTDKNCFVWNEGNFYTNQTCYIITNANKYVLSILNSKIINLYISFIASALGSGAFRWIKQYVEKLPIPKISKTAQQPFINLVNQILAKKKIGENTTDLEAQIDQLVYNLYQLTADEIKIIEN